MQHLKKRNKQHEEEVEVVEVVEELRFFSKEHTTTIRPFFASYDCVCRLAAVGISLDYLANLPRGG